MRILTRCTLRVCVLVVAPLVKLERPSCVTRLDAIQAEIFAVVFLGFGICGSPAHVGGHYAVHGQCS